MLQLVHFCLGPSGSALSRRRVYLATNFVLCQWEEKLINLKYIMIFNFFSVCKDTNWQGRPCFFGSFNSDVCFVINQLCTYVYQNIQPKENKGRVTAILKLGVLFPPTQSLLLPGVSRILWIIRQHDITLSLSLSEF